MREEIKELRKLGQMPTELIQNDETIMDKIKRYDELLSKIVLPIDYDEAMVLVKLFPEGFFYDLHWDLLKLIESILPNISEEKYLDLINECPSPEWKELLAQRFQNWLELKKV